MKLEMINLDLDGKWLSASIEKNGSRYDQAQIDEMMLMLIRNV